MPLAWVSQSHMVASAADFEAFLQRTGPVEYEPGTFAAVLPSRTALQTRPCMLHPQIGASSPPRPWLSAWNQAERAQLCQVGTAMHAATKIGEEKAGGLFFFRDSIVELPQI